MSATSQTWRTAWEPFTPRGVAAFAGGSLGRLLLAQLLVALLAAGSVVWFMRSEWFPVVREAIQQLPAQGEISNGRLDWKGDSPVQLSENRFLGLAVDLYHSGQLGRAAHLQVEFGAEDFRIYSLPGYQIFEYPAGGVVAFNRTELEPWWGAWEPGLLVGIGVATVAGLMIGWLALATLYALPVRVFSFLLDHDLNWRQSWRLAGAAMLPGTLFLTAGIVAYGLKGMDLIRLGGICGLQFVIGWIYLVVCPFFCPRTAAKSKVNKNPFAATATGSSEHQAPSSGETPDSKPQSGTAED